MQLIRLRLHFSVRRALYATLALSWCTGIAFYVLSRWVLVEGEFGPQKHPWQFPILKVHGAAAFLMLMGIGAMFAQHVPTAWRTRRSRPLGIVIIAMLSFMALSAWCLYYLADEHWRPILGTVHASVGLCLPLVLTIHIVGGRRQRRALAQVRRSAVPGTAGSAVPLKDRLHHPASVVQPR